MFHVPEAARDRDHPRFATTTEDGQNGLFDLPSPEPGWVLALVCSDGCGWEHVSVSAYRTGGTWRRNHTRVPTWKEMCFVKDTCWDGEDVVVQFHPRAADYVNLHPHVLHLWRPTTATIPTPPPILVGVKGVTVSV